MGMTIAERNNKLKHFITCLKCEVSGKCCDVNCPTQYDAGNMGEIIENLEAISKELEQEPCEDCIPRKRTCDYILEFGNNEYSSEEECELLKLIADGVNHLPSVRTARNHAKWITWEEADNVIPSPKRHECSNCHDCAQVLVNGMELLSDFCPNCGAKMVEPQESEDNT